MKKRYLVVTILMGLGTAFGQIFTTLGNKGIVTDNHPLTGEEWRLQLVEHLLMFPSPVTNGATQLYGMGDEAAVDLLKILGTRAPLTAAESQAALDILGMAFEKPTSIIVDANRQPAATMFLLRHLETTSLDASVKERASKVRATVLASIAQLAKK